MMSFLTLGVSKFVKKIFVQNKGGTAEEALKYNRWISSIPERPSLISQENSTSLWNFDLESINLCLDENWLYI